MSEENKAKHTPGPWFRDECSGITCDVRAKSGRRIAKTWGLQCSDRSLTAHNKAECDANARLIAAAPDMLKALKDALFALEIKGVIEKAGTTGLMAIADAKSAIAKAEGSSP